MTDQMIALREALVAKFAASDRALTHYDPEENPYAGHDLARMADLDLPLLNMAPKSALAYDMEAARHQGKTEAKADTSASRMAQARARAERKMKFDALADAPIVPPQERMQQAWMVVAHLVPTIERIAAGKARWAQRYLGGNIEDVPQMALERLALMLAKGDQDLSVLEQAASELGAVQRETGQIPRDQMTADEKAERKAVKRARKLLMGALHNRTMGALVDTFTAQRNLAEGDLDIITTVMASVGGAGDSDPLFNRHLADKAPSFMGTKFQRPDGIDSALLATAISGAITDRGLDPLVEFMLNDEHRRVDGAVQWSKHAEAIFRLTPGGIGEHYWDLVVTATTGRRKDGSVWAVDRARKARGDAARAHVRNLFGFLPSVIVGIIESFDPKPIGFSADSHRKVLASDWELFYAPVEADRREMLSPVLRFADATEAAHVLLTHLSDLIDSSDMVSHYVNS